MAAIAHWWNGSWGTITRKDVWLSELPDGRFEVRWRGGDWRDRDGRHIYSKWDDAKAAVEALYSESEGWRELSTG